MNKIIAFANSKGGVGKTTICGMFANYLNELGKPVTVIDVDIQQSLYRHRQRELAKEPDKKEPWRIVALPSRKTVDVVSIMEKTKGMDGYVLVDCPGNFKAEALQPFFANVTHVVVPITYDEDSIDATGLFVKEFRQLSSTTKILFAPNRFKTDIGKQCELKLSKKTIEILGRIGYVAPRIKENIAVQRYSTIYPLDYYQKEAINHSFDGLLEEIDKENQTSTRAKQGASAGCRVGYTRHTYVLPKRMVEQVKAIAQHFGITEVSAAEQIIQKGVEEIVKEHGENIVIPMKVTKLFKK